MKALVEKFYEEPVFALGVVEVVDLALTAQGVIPTMVGGVIAVVVTGIQRQLVRPDKTTRRRR